MTIVFTGVTSNIDSGIGFVVRIPASHDGEQVEDRALGRSHLSERQTTNGTPAVMLYASSIVRVSVSKHGFRGYFHTTTRQTTSKLVRQQHTKMTSGFFGSFS
jgi:hypothetical protein